MVTGPRPLFLNGGPLLAPLRSRGRPGQAVVLVLLILFVLVVISAVFVAILSRNLAMTSRGREASSTGQLAAAGIDFANQMLTTSPLGADWRPPFPPAPKKLKDDYSPLAGYDEQGNAVSAFTWKALDTPEADDPDYRTYYDAEEISSGLAPQPVVVYDKPATDPTRVVIGTGYLPGFAKYPDPRELPLRSSIEGYFLLKIEYDPKHTDHLSKYIKITSLGHSLRDPLVFRTLVAYKPLGITEYVRFVTNADRSSRDNDWGIPPWINYNNNKDPSTGNPLNDEQYYEDPPDSGNWVRYEDGIYDDRDRSAITDLTGPVRFQGDVFFRGANFFRLWPNSTTKYRNDRFELVGDLKYGTVDTAMGTIVDLYDNIADPYNPVHVYNIASSPYEKPAAFTYQDSQGNVVLRRHVRRIAPPDIFAKDPATGVERYEALTKRSGSWIKVAGKDKNNAEYIYSYERTHLTADLSASELTTMAVDDASIFPPSGTVIIDNEQITYSSHTSTSFDTLTRGANGTTAAPHTTGAFVRTPKVFPAGCFINNPTDVQFSHNLESLRGNFLRPVKANGSRNDYWTGSTTVCPSYEPLGVTITLWPGALDSNDMYPVTWDPTVPDCPKITLTRSDGPNFNGVTYDSGSGTWSEEDAGASLDVPYPPNGIIYCTGNVIIHGSLPQRGRIPAAAHYYFDNLTVVSGATIYIDASLMTPQGSTPGLSLANRSYIALLARDMAVLNPTFSGRAGGGSSTIILNGDVSLQANAPGSQATHYEIRPGGSYVLRFDVVTQMNDPTLLTLTHSGADPGPTIINVLINGQFLDFDPNTAGTQNKYTFASSPTVPPDHPTQSDHLSPDFETKSWNITSYLDLAAGAVNYITVQLDPSSSTSYWLENLKLTSEIQIGGGSTGGGGVLVYAQNGSWFVIPGKWADASSPTGQDAIDGLRYNTPIFFWGAISESHPADSPAVADWVNKWSYPYYDLPGDYLQKKDLPLWKDMKPYWGTIKYEFDDDLINNRRGPLSILPVLPVSPDLIYESEE